MRNLTQAPALVVQQLILLLYPAALLIGFTYIVGNSVRYHVPTWITVIAAIISVPLVLASRIAFRRWSTKRRAARLGAVMPPSWNGKKIGNIDIGARLRRSWKNGYLSDHLWDTMHEIGPTYEFYCVWNSTFVTSDANVIKTILATDFTNYVKGEGLRVPMHSVLGTGVFNSDGEMWKFHRSMTRPFFNRDRISHFEIFDRHAEQALCKMKERLRSGYSVDFQDLISRFTLDSASEFLFGTSVHTLQSSLPYPHNAPSYLSQQESTTSEDFARAFAQAQMAIAQRVRRGWAWPWFEFRHSETDPHMRVVDTFLEPILKEALRKTKDKEWLKKEIQDDETLLDHLVRFTSDPVVLHDEVLNIMIAGRDTTASVLTMAIYFLSQYPAVLARLRAEILEHVGSVRRPTYDDIRDMKCLRAVLNETMRLYPAVPWNVRFAVSDAVVPSADPERPYFVPAGTPISYSVHCMHRRKDYWGPDAEEFDPNRFLDERVHKYLTPNPFIFLPFNAGPRICLGQQFAYNEMSFFLIRLLQQFERIEFDLDSQPPDSRPPAEWAGCPGRKGVEKFWPKAHLTLYSESGMWVKMREALTEGDPV